MNKMDRKHLTPPEVERLLSATKGTRTAERDHALILLAFRHGLRASEVTALQLSDVDLESRQIHVRRLKGGLSMSQPMKADEIRSIRSWLTERARMAPDAACTALFVSERRRELSRGTLNALIARLGVAAEIAVHVHPHMLRHACGYALANRGADTRLIQDYLGHRNIAHTVIYTRLNSARFERLWD